MIVTQIPPFRNLLLADIDGIVAARMEGATRRRISRVRHVARENNPTVRHVGIG